MEIQLRDDFFENKFVKRLPPVTQMLLIRIMQKYGNKWQEVLLNSKTFGELSEDLVVSVDTIREILTPIIMSPIYLSDNWYKDIVIFEEE